MSMSRGFRMASVTAALVMALNTTRCTVAPLMAFFFCSTSSTCQEMASPSRSGSVARMILSAPLAASAMSFSRLADRAVLGRQVADVTVGRQDGVVRAQVLVDGLGLGRALDDDDVHAGVIWL